MNVKQLGGLDGLRFISISFVVLHHLFTFKSNFGFTGFDLPVLGLIGYYGIQFFFMGSGFLITYLLWVEHQEYGRISLSNFYLRRILRIWPAYYLLVCIALLILLKNPYFEIPGLSNTYLQADYKKSNLFYFLFLPHLQPFFFPTAPYIHQTYTIGIEEQFYIIWGLLFFFFRRFLIYLFALIVIISPLLNWLHNDIHQRVTNFPVLNTVKSAITYFQYSRFSTFAIGSLFGYAYFNRHRWIYVFQKPVVQLVLYALIGTSIAFDVSPLFFRNEYISLLMACLMLSATFTKESLIPFHKPWLSALGRISYGIYLYHIIAIVLASRFTLALFSTQQRVGALLFLVSLTMVLSILFGSLSYYGFEKYFLKLKRFFRRVKIEAA